MSHASAHSNPELELSLPEMLADPIVQMVMARDGVTKQDVEGLIGAVRDRMAGRQMAKHETSRHESSTSTLDDSSRRQRTLKPE